MSERKFTPGSWTTAHEDTAIVAGTMTLARVYWSEGRSGAENHANAHLLAAAPDLYAALRSVEFVTVWSDDADECWRECPYCNGRDEHEDRCGLAAALAKADGAK